MLAVHLSILYSIYCVPTEVGFIFFFVSGGKLHVICSCEYSLQHILCSHRCGPHIKESPTHVYILVIEI